MAGLLAPQVSTVIRSLLSKTVSEEDLAKVYTVMGSLEALTPLASTPLLTMIYDLSLTTYPGAVYLAEAGFLFVVLILFCIIVYLQKINQNSYNELNNDDEL